MFGIVRPCRHRLRGRLFGEWTAHLCGLCLTLRDVHGQSARLVTNYDGLLVSVLAEAQNPAIAPHRTAGPCALRRLKRAEVIDASAVGAQLAASVSLLLAAGKIRDHVADRDGAYARRLVAAGAGLAASRWQAAGQRVGASIGFDAAQLTDAIARQARIERSATAALADVTEPTETAVSAAFAHTAVLAGRPANAGPLAQAGLYFGRIAHLIDAIEDLAADEVTGAYNPLLATGTTPLQAAEHCSQALSGLRRSISSLELERPTLTGSLLAGEVGVAVDRAFTQIMRDAGAGGPDGPGGPGPADATPPADQPGQFGQPADPFKQAPWQQASDPSQLPPRGRNRGDGCEICGDGCECCGGCCEAASACDCSGC